MKRTTVILMSSLALTAALVVWQQAHSPENIAARKALVSAGSAEFAKVARTADQFVSKAGVDWGQPIRIEWQSLHGRYLVLYQTPESESRIFGSRAVHVEESGKVWCPPRG